LISILNLLGACESRHGGCFDVGIDDGPGTIETYRSSVIFTLAPRCDRKMQQGSFDAMKDYHQVTVAGVNEYQERCRGARHGQADAVDFERFESLPSLGLADGRCVMAEPGIGSCHQPELGDIDWPVFFDLFDLMGQIRRHSLLHIHGASSSALADPFEVAS
jgi:hypothetical protein